MEKEYYTVSEIKEMFKFYRDPLEMDITDQEYQIFCEAISKLPKKIVDRTKEEIRFVTLSLIKKQAACYLNIEEICNKKGIIFLSPLVFNFYSDDAPVLHLDTDIMHEVAHHILGHHGNSDIEKRKKQEDEAYAKVEEWYIKWLKNHPT